MKQLFILSSLLACLSCHTLCAIGDESTKIYIPREAVVVTEDSIALIIGDDDYFPLDALYADNEGLFIYESQITSKGSRPRK